ncbi:MAG: hypothetical protein LKF36_15310 [Lactobacillus sp.]|jgi:hypothetical protein|nr:hypothetical protein [Lactobacillus sp.]
MLVEVKNGIYVNTDQILVIRNSKRFKAWEVWVAGEIGVGVTAPQRGFLVDTADKDKIVEAMQQTKTGGRA